MTSPLEKLRQKRQQRQIEEIRRKLKYDAYVTRYINYKNNPRFEEFITVNADTDSWYTWKYDELYEDDMIWREVGEEDREDLREEMNNDFLNRWENLADVINRRWKQRVDVINSGINNPILNHSSGDVCVECREEITFEEFKNARTDTRRRIENFKEIFIIMMVDRIDYSGDFGYKKRFKLYNLIHTQSHRMKTGISFNELNTL
jgi:hypothetical protein